MENGASAKIAVTGNEGLVGIALFMGGESTPSRAVVDAAGHAHRLPAKFLRREFERGGELQHMLLRFTQALITHMARTAVCNRHHTIEQQLCRWLLLSLDRLQSNELNKRLRAPVLRALCAIAHRQQSTSGSILKTAPSRIGCRIELRR